MGAGRNADADCTGFRLAPRLAVPAMMALVHLIDRISAFVCKVFAWAILGLTLAISYEVFSRYLFSRPTTWASDVSFMLYGTLFMTAGAYALSRNGHVRGDFLYRTWRPRVQAGMDLALYLLFFFPGIAALIYAGTVGAERAWISGERTNSPWGAPLGPYRTLLPAVAVLLALQGLAEVLRCVDCLRHGRWAPRRNDVEELETAILAEHAAHDAEKAHRP